MAQYVITAEDRASVHRAFAQPMDEELLSDRDWFSRWQVVAQEPTRTVMRNNDFVYLIVQVANGKTGAIEIVDGDAAKRMNFDYGFRLSEDKKAEIRRKLPPGGPAVDLLSRAFGANAREAPLMAQVPQPGGVVKRYHRVLDGGLVIVPVHPGDKLGELEFVTGEAAFEAIKAAIAAAKR